MRPVTTLDQFRNSGKSRSIRPYGEPVPTLEQTVYEVAKDALRQQEHTLTELRARTGMLLTASSLTTSRFGGLLASSSLPPSDCWSRSVYCRLAWW
jgi:hypothetical protein